MKLIDFVQSHGKGQIYVNPEEVSMVWASSQTPSRTMIRMSNGSQFETDMACADVVKKISNG